MALATAPVVESPVGDAPGASGAGGPAGRLEELLERLAVLQGQRNAIDAELVDVVAELDRDDLWGYAGARSLEACVAWKTGSSPANARVLASAARGLETFPRCARLFRDGVLSLDQLATIADRAPRGTDDHYAELAPHATVSQLRMATRLARQNDDPRDDAAEERRPPERSVHRLPVDDEHAQWRILLPHVDDAVFEAALASHLDALVAQWRRDHDAPDAAAGTGSVPPFPTLADAFLRLIEHGWDADATVRPHGHRTTVVLHVDVESKVTDLHLGPALSEAERRFLSCDSLVQVWFERDGIPIGVGRETKTVPRRLRRALERRHVTCAVPGCGATRGLHAHHLVHWEDGGATDLDNLALVCPPHHRLHHRGIITIRGPGHAPTVLDATGRVMTGGADPRPPGTARPAADAYDGPSGERAHWRWYDPPRPAREHDAPSPN